MSYSRLAASRALAETKSVWNVNRVWIYFASPLTGLLARAVFVGVKDLGNWHQLLLFAAFGFVVTWVGTYLINLIRVPAILHREQATIIDGLTKENHRFQSQLDEKTSLSQEALQLLIAGAESEKFPSVRQNDRSQIYFIMAGRLNITPHQDTLTVAKYREAVKELHQKEHIDAEGHLTAKGLERAANEPTREQIFAELWQKFGSH